MKTISELYKIASEIDSLGYHNEADELTIIAMQKTAQGAGGAMPLPGAGDQMYGLGDISGILSELVGKSVAPYAGQAIGQLLSGDTALKNQFQEYVAQLDPKQNKTRDIYQDGRSPIEQSTSIATFDPGDINTGKSGQAMLGGQRTDDVSKSMWKNVSNPSQAEAGLKAFLGGLLGQLGFSRGLGSKGMEGLNNIPWMGGVGNARAGNTGTYGAGAWSG